MSLSIVSLLAHAVLAATSHTAKVISLPPLHVSGTEVVDPRGHKVWLRGVNAACLEFNTTGEGHILKTIDVAKEWNANIVRLPLSEDRWFGKAPDQSDGGVAYRALVKQVVQESQKDSVYILLDLHWNDADEWGKNIGQHQMPDMHSLDFWKACAGEYKNQSNVLFDLYNEPHDISWDLWKNGGEVKEQRGAGARQGAFVPVTYQTPGMQKMLDTVRSTGARNMVVAGGLDWAYDLSGFQKGYMLKDSRRGNGVIYACHAYTVKGDTVPQFLAKLDKALPTVPVIVSEFGNQPRGARGQTADPWVVSVVNALDQRHCNWIAWDLHPGAGPCLISDWNYTPTPSFGVVVKQALSQR